MSTMSDYEYDDEDTADYGDDDMDDYGDDDMADKITASSPPENDVDISVLTSPDIQRRVDEATSEISSLLSISTAEAVVLLSKYGWNPSKIHEEWFSDEAKTRKDSGLTFSSDRKKVIKGEFFCGICLDNYNGETDENLGFMSPCGHVFCEMCWGGYVSTSVTDGAGCLSLRCPEPKCGASIAGIIDEFLAKDDAIRAKYDDQVLRSYVESRKSMKWCPSPGCEFVLECQFRQIGATNSHLDVVCNCPYGFCYGFCWNCSEENHSPSSCDLVARWAAKNNSESENKNWIICNTKPCPKCGKSIEKNDGCMHMTCRAPCRHEFCWLCLADWPGYSHRCNKYEVDKNSGAGKLSKEQKIREKARSELNKYIHYHERWTENHKSRLKSIQCIKDFDSKHMNTLIHAHPQTDVVLMKHAWTQIVECRRVLKWSYAYGYYIPDDEKPKRHFYEFVQGQAEGELEKLHHLAETEGFRHINEAEDNLKKREEEDDEDFSTAAAREEVARAEFKRFLAEVFSVTKITKQFFDNLVKALAQDLPLVNERSDDLYCNPAQLMYYLEEEEGTY